MKSNISDLIFSENLSEGVKLELINRILDRVPQEDVVSDLFFNSNEAEDFVRVLEALPRLGVFRDIKKEYWNRLNTLDEALIFEVSDEYIRRKALGVLDSRRHEVKTQGEKLKKAEANMTSAEKRVEKNLKTLEPVGLASIDRAYAPVDKAKAAIDKAKTKLDAKKSRVEKVKNALIDTKAYRESLKKKQAEKKTVKEVKDVADTIKNSEKPEKKQSKPVEVKQGTVSTHDVIPKKEDSAKFKNEQSKPAETEQESEEAIKRGKAKLEALKQKVQTKKKEQVKKGRNAETVEASKPGIGQRIAAHLRNMAQEEKAKTETVKAPEPKTEQRKPTETVTEQPAEQEPVKKKTSIRKNKITAATKNLAKEIKNNTKMSKKTVEAPKAEQQNVKPVENKPAEEVKPQPEPAKEKTSAKSEIPEVKKDNKTPGKIRLNRGKKQEENKPGETKSETAEEKASEKSETPEVKSETKPVEAKSEVKSAPGKKQNKVKQEQPKEEKEHAPYTAGATAAVRSNQRENEKKRLAQIDAMTKKAMEAKGLKVPPKDSETVEEPEVNKNIKEPEIEVPEVHKNLHEKINKMNEQELRNELHALQNKLRNNIYSNNPNHDSTDMSRKRLMFAKQYYDKKFGNNK